MASVIIQRKTALFAVFVFLVSTLCAGCAVRDRLRWADDRAGELLDNLGAATSTPAATSSDFKLPDIDFADISGIADAIKNKIAGSETASGTGGEAEKPEDAVPASARDIAPEEKDRIDAWLKANGYNRYGDPAGTFYTGGTPLFDEATGEAVERFDYILKKHPDILTKI